MCVNCLTTYLENRKQDPDQFMIVSIDTVEFLLYGKAHNTPNPYLTSAEIVEKED